MAAVYLTKTYGTGKKGPLKWAIAGRRLNILQELKKELAIYDVTLAEHLSIIIADSSDVKSLQSMVDRTRVVISTTGPFSKYGTHILLYELCIL